MSRGQQGQVFNQTQGENQQYNQNAQTSFNTAQQDIGNFQSAVNQASAANPYVTGGAAQTAENQQLADTAAGMGTSAGSAIQGAAVRTGQNPGGAIAATEQMQENNERNLAGQEASATENRIGAGTQYQNAILGEAAQGENMQDQLAQQQAAAAQGAIGTEEQAAQTPSFMDELGQAALSAGAGVVSAYCPAERSLFLMADGTEKQVERLVVGDLIAGIDGEAQTVEEIQSALSPIILTVTRNGYFNRTSPTHAFALPLGGFVSALKSPGREIVTARGRSPVLNVEPDGVAMVFNVITNGSHTYRADGIWALGVGDGERRMDMEMWAKIGAEMMAAAEVSRGE